MPSSVSLCGVCSQGATEADGVEKCKSCCNISLYRDKLEKNETEIRERNNNIEKQEFPGPCEIETNEIYGNYVVASRRIQEGELIIREKPMFVGPYGPNDLLPYCIVCYKDIGLSSKCSKCKWPVCNSFCEKDSSHANNECKVLSDNNVRPKGNVSEYFFLEVLRCLLGRQNFPKKWARVLQLEPHTEARKDDFMAVATMILITDFIRNKCNLTEFDDEIIDRVVGVLSINTFWTFKDLKTYASLLFDKVSLIAHDCDPNTRRKIVRISENEPFDVEMQIHARRIIEKGELISIHYVDPAKKVEERRVELKDIFYFDCCCSRCLVELMEETGLNKDDSQANTIANIS